MGKNNYLVNPETSQVYNSDDFDLREFLSTVNMAMLAAPANDPDAQARAREYRREITKYNPLLWMLLYVPHLMRSEQTGNKLSVNDLNLLLAHHALEFAAPKTKPKRKGLRKHIAAPRGSSKTTTTQALILWAICHRHIRYAYIFSGSDSQAEAWLADLKAEIFSNKLIKADYKGLTEPARLIKKKVAEADNRNLYRSQSGITLEARSIWSGVVGAKRSSTGNDGKRESKRPDLLIVDDASKGEGAGSVHQSGRQLEILLGTILPLNDSAPVWSVGTVHYSGSVEDELVRSVLGEDIEWVEEENFEVHYVLPLVQRDDGTLRSMWAERWSVKFLLSESSKRTYSKDFLNRPIPPFAGSGWEQSDFVVPPDLPVCSFVLLSVDPGISKAGDPTGLAVIGFSAVAKQAVVFDVMAVPKKAMALKAQILDLCEQYNVDEVVWEKNQGGEALAEATLGDDFPLPVHLIHSHKDKLVRAEMLLTRYKKGQVVHSRPFPAYEAECKAFPAFISSPNMVDAMGQGVEYLATRGRQAPSLSVSARRRR